MKKRLFWQSLIEKTWENRSIIWLSGVRRAGKTMLCQSLEQIHYYDCELPSVRAQLEDAELFFQAHKNQRIAFDEIHKLNHPAQILKIAADHFPRIKIIATGSSTLSASRQFGDTLTGRKTEIWLTPMLSFESALFGKDSIAHRLLQGGLPPYFMENQFPEKEFAEWLDSYWAKDIQELFQLEKRYAFQKFVELIFAQSGGLFEATRFASACEISRTTIYNYLSVLETTFVAHVIRPFHSRLSNEIIAAPKVYGFDTGMVCFAKGWHTLRPDDMGLLWEQYVLNELHGQLQTQRIFYWRNKQQHEIDFIYFKNRNQRNPIAIECKWHTDQFDPSNLIIFRKQYPKGENYVVGHNIQKKFQKKYGSLIVNLVNIKDLVDALEVIC